MHDTINDFTGGAYSSKQLLIFNGWSGYKSISLTIRQFNGLDFHL